MKAAKSRSRVARLWSTAFLACVAFSIGSMAAAWATADTPIRVSQKGREFRPGELSLKKGDTVRIVNDDADLLHHAYIDAEGFSFDSGDQEPGSKTDVVFSIVGDFKVLCGIHPKMKLLVHVL